MHPYSSLMPIPQAGPQMPRPVGNWLGGNANLLTMLGLGLLDKRQNNQIPYSQIGQQALAGSQIDQERRQQSQTVQWLMKNRGLSKQDAQAAATNRDVLNQYMSSDKSKYALQPFYAQDAQGNLQAYQLDSAGGLRPLQLPEGSSPAPPMHFGDLGTSIAGMNTRTGQVETAIPKDVAGAAAESALGGVAGTTAANLPQVESTAQNILGMIDSIERDPNLKAGTGLSSWTTAIPGTSMYGFGQKVKQLTGQTFLQAYQVLKGAGAITEKEGQAATEAMARLNTAQTEEDFRTALNDLRTIITNGVMVARQRANLAGPTGAAPTGNLTPLGNGEFEWSPGQ